MTRMLDAQSGFLPEQLQAWGPRVWKGGDSGEDTSVPFSWGPESVIEKICNSKSFHGVKMGVKGSSKCTYTPFVLGLYASSAIVLKT